jgi:hypothetical protein
MDSVSTEDSNSVKRNRTVNGRLWHDQTLVGKLLILGERERGNSDPFLEREFRDV